MKLANALLDSRQGDLAQDYPDDARQAEKLAFPSSGIASFDSPCKRARTTLATNNPEGRPHPEQPRRVPRVGHVLRRSRLLC